MKTAKTAEQTARLWEFAKAAAQKQKLDAAQKAAQEEARQEEIRRQNLAFQRQASANLQRADAMATVRHPRPSPTDEVPLRVSGGVGPLSAAEQDAMILDLGITREGAALTFGRQQRGPSAGQILLYGLAGLAGLGIVVLALKK